MAAKRRKLAWVCGVVVIMAIALGAWLQWPRHNSVNHELLRLHIVADSDSQEDQADKLAVRDALLAAYAPELENKTDIDGVREYMKEQLPKIEAIASSALSARGKTMPVEASLSVQTFPDRLYGGTLYPAGQYEALRVTIGSGEGQNWWCVMFPPLCFIEGAAPPENDETPERLAGEAAEQWAAGEKEMPTVFRSYLWELIERWFGKGE